MDHLFNDELLCHVLDTEYDHMSRKGVVYVPLGQCVDMAGVIAFFRRLDPNVRKIDVLAGGVPDAFYWRENVRWRVGLYGDRSRSARRKSRRTESN